MFKRIAFSVLALLVILLIGCNVTTNDPTVLETIPVLPSSTAVPDFQASPTPSATPMPENTAVPPTPTATPFPPDLSITSDSVFLYPVPQIYTGDKVTFQIRPYVPDTISSEEVIITVFVDGLEVGSGPLNDYDLNQDAYGLVKWAWETSNRAGTHQVQVFLDLNDTIQVGDENPNNNQITMPVVVKDRAQLPSIEANATWVTAETTCCRVFVVSGTAAYRDLPELLAEVETAARQAATRLNEQPQKKFDIYFIDRMIGQGGYAGSDLVISYLDRDYAGIQIHQLLVHELVHLLDQQFAPQRITFLAEGIAVWASDGHYKAEDINQRAAALLDLNLYVPLTQLVNDFYPVQHEIGYLQAASFVNYLVDKYGWTRFRDFYSNANIDDADSATQALDVNLQIYYNQSLAGMEAEWLAYLNGLQWNGTAVTDLETTLYLYNTMRAYQQQYDPPAYFLTAWLPYPNDVRQSGTPADLSRHSEAEINVTMEVMLQAANQNLLAGDYNRATVILDSINRVLTSNGSFQDPLAENYRLIVNLAITNHYRVQEVNLTGEQAQILVTGSNSNILNQLTLTMRDQEWLLAN